MKNLRSILILVAVCGFVRAEDNDPLPGPLSQLQAVWRDDLSKRDSFKLHNAQLAEQLFESKRLIVRETTGQAVD